MCVRVCDEIQGQRELSFVNRGMLTEVSTDFARPLSCEFCGQCASICPVGAISSKWLVGTGREFELKKTDTTCSFCSLGCTLTLGEKDRKVVYVSSPPGSPNEGNLCVKGRYGWPYVYSDRRLAKPLIRKDGELREVGWDEALKFVADRLNELKKSAGPASIGALGSERLTTEESYVFNRFVRTVLETPHLDHSGGFAYRALVDGLAPSFGYPATTNSIREIRKAKVMLLLGADLTETHPVAKNEVIVSTGRIRSEVIVVDSVRTKLTERPGQFLPVAPGMEVVVANAMLKWILDEGKFDKTALDLKVDGFDELAASLADYTLENAAELTGLAAEQISDATKKYAEAETAVIVMTAGMNRSGADVELARAAANLALVTGRYGKEACGVYVLGEKANFQGAVDMGLAPDLLPGFCRIDDEAARTKFEAAWGAPLPKEPGLDARQMLSKAAEGEIRGLYVVGENPLDTYPDRASVEQALGKLEFLVVHDMFMTPTAKMAHAVLPVASFAEKNGTFTSVDRRVQRLRPSSKSNPAKSDLELFTALAAAMGKASMTYSGPEQVMSEIAELVDVYRGISYDRLGDNGLAWPCIDPDDPGKTILYEGGFPGGKAHLVPAAPLPKPDGNGLPFYLIPGILKFHSGSFSQWSSSLLDVCGESFAEMNAKDAKALGVKDAETVKITSGNGVSAQLKVKVSRRALAGTVVVPYHFASWKFNAFTSWDCPAVKVTVEKA